MRGKIDKRSRLFKNKSFMSKSANKNFSFMMTGSPIKLNFPKLKMNRKNFGANLPHSNFDLTHVLSKLNYL